MMFQALDWYINMWESLTKNWQRHERQRKPKRQITTNKTDDWMTRTPQKTGVNSCSPEWLENPAPYVAHVMLLRLVQSRWSVEFGHINGME